MPNNAYTTIAEQLRVIASQVEALGVVSTPIDPPPVIVPPPIPVTPPSVPLGSIKKQIINPARMLYFVGWYYGGRYDRFQTLRTLKAAPLQTVIVRVADMVAAPALDPVPLTLTMNGLAVASATPVAGSREVVFSFDASSTAEGWYELGLLGADSWSVPAMSVYVQKGATAQPQATMPVFTASYGLVHPIAGTQTIAHHAMVPAVYAPVSVPLAPREMPPFSTIPARKDLVQTQLAVCRPDDNYRPAVSKAGVWTTANRMPYFWSDLTDKIPKLPLLDGPRGVGSVVMPTHLEVGTAAPVGIGFVGNVYFCDPWRAGKIRQNGTVITMVGYRHKTPPTYWGDTPELELVGDWSAIPPERRGFNELWGMAWDMRRTGGLNAGEPSPDPRERGMIPHPVGGGMVMFLSDMLNLRVIRCEFPHDTHFAYERTKVTEFLTGLGQPWDVVCADGELWVSERTSNRVAVYDATTAAFKRSYPFQAPEGLFILDGTLYVGSRGAKKVWKLDIATGAVTVFRDLTPWIDNNSMYVKLAVSDGGFGPRGMVGVCTWSKVGYGYPNLFAPDGKEIQWLAGSTPATRKGLPWVTPGYPTAVGFGPGRMVCGSSHEGVTLMTQALPTDAVLDPLYAAGEREYFEAGYHLTHGHAGHGFYGLPLPWGKSVAIDEYLRKKGH